MLQLVLKEISQSERELKWSEIPPTLCGQCSEKGRKAERKPKRWQEQESLISPMFRLTSASSPELSTAPVFAAVCRIASCPASGLALGPVE